MESLLSELWPRHPTPESTLVAPAEKLGIGWHPLGSPDDAPDVARSMTVDIAQLLDWLSAHARMEAIDEAFNHDPVPAHGLAANGRSPHERNRGLVAAFLLGRDLGELAARRRKEVAFQGPRFAVAELEALLARLGVPRA
ncbi:Hypothetical protein A7982_05756 [Minicystis rosea]|nr:Hypothetical protein A7982_05756 [Minicystis rosea]